MRDIHNTLLKRIQSIPIFAGHNHDISWAEEVVLQTTAMQRLRGLRQMGLAHLEFPLADHTRYIHSIGTAYWAVRMFAGLTQSGDELSERNKILLDEMSESLGSTYSIELVVRLYALIHDVGLLPLGHTLKIQLSRFDEEEYGFARTFGRAVSAILSEYRAIGASKQTKTVLEEHIALAEAVAHAPRILRGELLDSDLSVFGYFDMPDLIRVLPMLSFVYDLVHGVCAADLIDWCHRDITAIGLGSELPNFPLTAGAIVKVHYGDIAYPSDTPYREEPIFRYGLDCREKGGPGLVALFRLASFHRLRFEVILLGNYTGKKLIADSTLEKAIRMLGAVSGEKFEDSFRLEDLHNMGDDSFLQAVEDKLDGYFPNNILRNLRNGVFFRSSVELRESSYEGSFQEAVNHLVNPEQKTALETSLAEDLDILVDDIIVSVTPENMQGKSPDTIVNVGNFGWQPLCKLSRHANLVCDLANLEYAYTYGAKITLLLRSDLEISTELVRDRLEQYLIDPNAKRS